MAISNELARISTELYEFYSNFKDTTGNTPYEATVTDILTWELWKLPGFAVSRTSMRTESREGHDLIVMCLREIFVENNQTGEMEGRPMLWICFLQAKVMKGEVVDFLYRRSNSGKQASIKAESNTLKDDVQELQKELYKLLSRQDGPSNGRDVSADVARCIRLIGVKHQQLEDLNTSAKSQLELLLKTVQAARNSQDGQVEISVCGGYVVYSAEGVYFLSIDDVVREINNVYTDGDDNDVGYSRVNALVTQALLTNMQPAQRPGLQAMWF